MTFPILLTAAFWLSRTKGMAMFLLLCGTLFCLCCGSTGSWTAQLPVSGRTRMARRIYSSRPAKRKGKVSSETPRIPARNMGRVLYMHLPCLFTAWGKLPLQHSLQKRNLCCFRFNGNTVPVAGNKRQPSSEGKPRRWRAKTLAARGGEGASIAQMYILHCLQGKYPLTPMPPAGG